MTNLYARRFFNFEADGGGAGSGSGSGEADKDKQDGGGAQDGGGGEGDKGKGKGEKTFSQAEVESIIKDRLDREKKAREKAEAKAKEESEAAALKEQAEYRKLSEKQATRIAELEGKVKDAEAVEERLKAAETAIKKQVDALAKSLPEHITKLLGRLDPVEQLAYLAENGEALGNKKKSSLPETPEGDGGGGNLSGDALEAAQRAQAQFSKTRF